MYIVAKKQNRVIDGVKRFAILSVLVLLAVQVKAAVQEDTHAKRVEQAAALIAQNHIDEAERELNSILKSAPKDAAALDLLGTIRAKQGKLSEAEALFVRAIRNDNQLVGAHMNLAYLYLLKGAPAKTALELKEVLRLDPNNADAADRLAWVLVTAGQLDDCIQFVEGARQARPVSVQMIDALGDAYLKKGNLEKAEENYLLALNEQSANGAAIIGLAQVAQSKGDASSAVLYLNRARNVIGGSPDLLYKFALISLNAQAPDDAIAALQKAIELRPDEPSYHFFLGVAWIKKVDLPGAEQSFRQSLKLQPDNPQGQTYLGYTLLKQKKYPEAREWLEKSVARDSSQYETFYYLGLIAQEENDDERAVELFGRAIKLSPSFASAHVTLGASYLKLKNYPLAKQELELAVKLKPDESKAHYNLALLYARIKEPQRAQEEMRIVERLKTGEGLGKETDLVAPSAPRPR